MSLKMETDAEFWPPLAKDMEHGGVVVVDHPLPPSPPSPLPASQTGHDHHHHHHHHHGCPTFKGTPQEAVKVLGRGLSHAPHSYYECCINVHVSSLLDHWLDWDRPSTTTTNPSSSSSSSSAKKNSFCACSVPTPPMSEDESSSLAPEVGDGSTDGSTKSEDVSSSSSSAAEEYSDDSSEVDEDINSSIPVHVFAEFADPTPWILRLLSTPGCDINKTDASGRTTLHYLLLGNNNKDHLGNMVTSARACLNGGADPNLSDIEGETPLLLVRHLLDRGCFREANEFAKLLIVEFGANVNATNSAHRSLLSYSVMNPEAVDLTRLLLNHGAQVWPPPSQQQQQQPSAASASAAAAATNIAINENNVVDQLTRERESSAFTWFLKSVIKSRSLDDFDEMTYLLCVAMGEDPQRMKRHVTSTMIHLGHGVSVLGPLFAKLKGQMMVYWSKPQDLRYICIKSIRKSLLKPNSCGGGCGSGSGSGSGNSGCGSSFSGRFKNNLTANNLENSVGKLKLPRKLQRYVKLEESLPYHQ